MRDLRFMRLDHGLDLEMRPSTPHRVDSCGDGFVRPAVVVLVPDDGMSHAFEKVRLRSEDSIFPARQTIVIVNAKNRWRLHSPERLLSDPPSPPVLDYGRAPVHEIPSRSKFRSAWRELERLRLSFLEICWD